MNRLRICLMFLLTFSIIVFNDRAFAADFQKFSAPLNVYHYPNKEKNFFGYYDGESAKNKNVQPISYGTEYMVNLEDLSKAKVLAIGDGIVMGIGKADYEYNIDYVRIQHRVKPKGKVDGRTIDAEGCTTIESVYYNLNNVQVNAGERVYAGMILGDLAREDVLGYPHLDLRIKGTGEYITNKDERKKHEKNTYKEHPLRIGGYYDPEAVIYSDYFGPFEVYYGRKNKDGTIRRLSKTEVDRPYSFDVVGGVIGASDKSSLSSSDIGDILRLEGNTTKYGTIDEQAIENVINQLSDYAEIIIPICAYLGIVSIGIAIIMKRKDAKVRVELMNALLTIGIALIGIASIDAILQLINSLT